MTSKLPKAVRDAMERLDSRKSHCVVDLNGYVAEIIYEGTTQKNELTRAFYAGALFGVKVAELMIEKKLPKSRAEIRRMEKEAKNA